MILYPSMPRDAPDGAFRFRKREIARKLFISCDLLINDDPGDDLRACIGMTSLPVEVRKGGSLSSLDVTACAHALIILHPPMRNQRGSLGAGGIKEARRWLSFSHSAPLRPTFKPTAFEYLAI